VLCSWHYPLPYFQSIHTTHIRRFLNQQDAALALSVQHVGLDRVWVTWYQQRAEWSLFWENG
jgi:hypothetical protein